MNATLGSAQTIFALSTNGREQLSVPGDASSAGHAIDFVVQAFLAGRRPEEIQTEHPDLRLSRIYAVIAFYLDRTERRQQNVAPTAEEDAGGDEE